MTFDRELQTLLEAPYAYLYLKTHDEAQAVALVTRAAQLSKRPVLEWSVTRGMTLPDGSSVPPMDFHALLDAIELGTDPALYVLKDPHPFLNDPLVVRRLREMEALVAAFGKTLVMISPVAVELPELSTDLLELEVPTPDRASLTEVSHVVFPKDRWPNLDREGLVSGALGLTSRQALRAFHRARLECQAAFVSGAAQFDLEKAVLADKRRIVRRSEVIEFVDTDRNMDDVGGLDELKEWLASRRDAFTVRARDYGLPLPKGLLLLGVQGCGKSLMAKVVARAWSLPLMRLEVGALFGGRTSPDSSLRYAIQTAESLSPSVLWIDEIEKIFDGEGADGQHRLLGSLLTWLQEKKSAVFFVATANRVDRLPPELLRKGRFDEIFFVDLPDPRSREQILSIHLRDRAPDAARYDVRALAEATRNFSGAELEQVVVAALYLAFGRGGDLTQADLLQAARQTIPLSKTYEDEIKALRGWAQERARFANRDSTMLDFFGGDRPTARK
jgi:ATP-dependent 26S proteasome regulatory subunit